MAKAKTKKATTSPAKSRLKAPLRSAKAITAKSKTPSELALTRHVKQGGKVSATSLLSPLPTREQPVRQAENDVEEVFTRLQCGTVPKSLPCRDSEYETVLTFLEGKLGSSTGGCLYISGVPGTGKTATVHAAITELQSWVEEGDLGEFRFIEINGMRLSEPKQAYVQIWKELNGTDKRVTAEHAAQLLDKFFGNPSTIKSPIVLLVDELDLLLTRKQTVLYQLFDWPSKPGCPLVVLAIANTMDLPERAMMGRVSSRLGLQRLTFQPYSYQQLKEIVLSRVEDLCVFEKEAVEFVARKVAGVSGDARRALSICLLAVELMNKKKKADEGNGTKVVTMGLVNEALKAITSSPKLIAISNASFFEKLFLQAIVTEFKRCGIEETSFSDVLSTLTLICQTQGGSVSTNLCLSSD
ncbi:origin recognition complex subunit 1-like isoform X2 [Sycon ciliatum]|uniref:origin recognition complex subunit 1-like isoform X2 n=1 Tax=Sycon ciliatum TaxID=27933 RepID=UPI0031F67EEB